MLEKKEIVVIALSDTHTLYDFTDAPDGDILIIAGDILMSGTISELRGVMVSLDMESHRWKHILLVPGNHDFILQQYYNQKLSLNEFMKDCGIIYYPKNLVISIEGIVELMGLKIFTWAWVPNLPNWAFHMFDNDVEKKLAKLNIPDEVDIVVSHGPPRGVLDWIKKHGAVGNSTMEEAFTFSYPIHIFGHIHEGYGRTLRDCSDIIKTGGADFRRYYNVATLNEYYKEQNEPIKIIINGREKDTE